jgi:hypothetical protein
MMVGISFDWFATYDRASNKSFGGSTRAIGSKISYEKKWAIRLFESKVKITASKVTIPANVSSQYISALLLVAAKLENGIELTLDGDHFYSIYQNDLGFVK